MTHVVHPYSHRLGILRDWKSRWFGGREKYKEYLRGDVLLREFLAKRLRGYYVADVDIERGENAMSIIIKTSRPGLVIGRSGDHMMKLKRDVEKFIHRKNIPRPDELKVDVEEVRNPEGNAAIISQMIAEQLEKRMPFRRVMKQTMEKVMANKEVKGARIALSGRLGGAEMSRREELKKGGIPLQTLRADIDFARERAHLPYGHIGIKVWVYRGEIFSGENQKKQ